MNDPKGLGWDRASNPKRYDSYAKKLLIPGWAGEVTDAEAEYISRELTGKGTPKVKLRQRWHTRKFTSTFRTMPPYTIRRMVKGWAEMSGGNIGESADLSDSKPYYSYGEQPLDPEQVERGEDED